MIEGWVNHLWILVRIHALILEWILGLMLDQMVLEMIEDIRHILENINAQ